MTRQWQVVVVSFELEQRQSVGRVLFRLNIVPICASSVAQCREILKGGDIGLVFCERQLPDGDYRDILEAVACSANEATKVVVLSGPMNGGEYQQAKSVGVFDIIPTPCRHSDIEWMVILARRRIQAKQLREGSHHAFPLRIVS